VIVYMHAVYVNSSVPTRAGLDLKGY
jgi:hypothetical protein